MLGTSFFVQFCAIIGYMTSYAQLTTWRVTHKIIPKVISLILILNYN